MLDLAEALNPLLDERHERLENGEEDDEDSESDSDADSFVFDSIVSPARTIVPNGRSYH